MRATGFAAILLVVVSAGAADAELFDAPGSVPDWSRRVEAMVHSLAEALTGGRAGDNDIVKPPANIDPKMAVMPGQLPDPMPIIPPGETGRQ